VTSSFVENARQLGVSGKQRTETKRERRVLFFTIHPLGEGRGVCFLQTSGVFHETHPIGWNPRRYWAAGRLVSPGSLRRNSGVSTKLKSGRGVRKHEIPADPFAIQTRHGRWRITTSGGQRPSSGSRAASSAARSPPAAPPDGDPGDRAARAGRRSGPYHKPVPRPIRSEVLDSSSRASRTVLVTSLREAREHPNTGRRKPGSCTIRLQVQPD